MEDREDMVTKEKIETKYDAISNNVIKTISKTEHKEKKNKTQEDEMEKIALDIFNKDIIEIEYN